MSSSKQNRTQPRKKSQQANYDSHEAKQEQDRNKNRNTNLPSTSQKSKQGLHKNDPVRESRRTSHSVDRSSSSNHTSKVDLSPQKSRSVDRNSNRQSLKKAPVKSTLLDTGKTNSKSKTTSVASSSSKSLNIKKKADLKSSSPLAKTSEKTVSKLSSRSPMKGPSGKSNVEIAKSFVRNANSSDLKKSSKPEVTKKNSSTKDKNHNKSQSKVDDVERPRTSTIRKGPPDINDFSSELRVAIDSNQHREGSSRKTSRSNSAAGTDDEDNVSYEEDFEDYDSDFEESDTDSDSASTSESSSSSSSENKGEVIDPKTVHNTAVQKLNSLPGQETVPVKQKQTESMKSREKTFLHMSDRPFIAPNKVVKDTVGTKILKSSHSFINFNDAITMNKEKKSKNRVLKRASELLEMVTLSDVSFNHLDIPPMKYDTFIRFYGKQDYKQVFVQTDNFNEEEVQTDEIEVANKWTQNPPNDNFGFGGDELENRTEVKDGLESLFHQQNVKLSSFVQNCSKVFLTLLDEEFATSDVIQTTSRRNELFYSDGYYLLNSPSFLKDIPVLNVYCSTESSHILTIHDGIIKVPDTNDERGVICVWNLLDNQHPQHILIAHSQPTCATFGPVGNDIVIAGMVDGTVLLWDVLDNSQAINEMFSLKSPTYSTAVILGYENHRSCIVAVQTISTANDDTSIVAKTNCSRNFHIMTLEDLGVINIWVAVEVLNPDFSGLDTDLGLAPGGKIRMVRSSTLLLYALSALQEIQRINIRTFDFRLVPYDSNRLLVTTDAGIILHINRQGEGANPRFYSSNSEFTSEVRCIVCSPHNEDLFLVGCSDGSAMLYNLKLVRPVLVFLLAAKGDPITLIQWSPIHPAIFVVLSSSSNLYLWNLLEDSLHPVNSYNFSDSRVTWFSFCKLQKDSSQQSTPKQLYMCLSQENGTTEVHTFKYVITDEQHMKQIEFMKNL